MKAQTSIDPKLIALLGRKLYSSHPVEIVVRELLQNSIDACKRAEVEPKISIGITQLSRDHVEIYCEDNGCGMTQEELVNDFLCLGGTNKRGTNSTGGFGIAKAAIMSGTYWLVETLGSTVCSQDVIEGKDIQELETPRDGTIVMVTIEEETSPWHLEAAASMVYTSDVDIHFRINGSGTTICIDDEHAGLRADKVKMDEKGDWKAFAFPKIELTSTREIKASNFIRLNGLTQFKYSKFYDDRETNIAIDVTTTLDPDSKDYPLTVSRERLNAGIQAPIQTFLNRFEGEPSATDSYVRRLTIPDNVKFLSGRILNGFRKFSGVTVYEKVEEGNYRIMSKDELSKFKEMISMIDPSSKSPIIKMINYQPSDETVDRDTKILLAWSKILQYILLEDTEFGIGFIGDENVKASLDETNEIKFLLINPNMQNYETDSKEAVIISMWESACHEVTHVYGGSRHDETFCSQWSHLMSITCNVVVKNLKRLASIL